MTPLIEELVKVERYGITSNNWSHSSQEYLYDTKIDELKIIESIEALKSFLNIQGYKDNHEHIFQFQYKKEELNYLMNINFEYVPREGFFTTNTGDVLDERNISYIQLIPEIDESNNIKQKYFVGQTTNIPRFQNYNPQISIRDTKKAIYYRQELKRIFEEIGTPLFKQENLKKGDLIQIHFDGAKSNKNIFLEYNEKSSLPYVCVSNGNEEAYRSGREYRTASWGEDNVDSINGIKHPLTHKISKIINSSFYDNNNKEVIQFVEKHLCGGLKEFDIKEYSEDLIKAQITNQVLKNAIHFENGARIKYTYTNLLTKEPITVDGMVIDGGTLPNKPLQGTSVTTTNITISYPRMYINDQKEYFIKENYSKMFSIGKSIGEEMTFTIDKQEPTINKIIGEVEFVSREEKQSFLNKLSFDGRTFDTLGQKLTISENNGVYLLKNTKKQEIVLDKDEINMFRTPTLEKDNKTIDVVSR